MSFGECWAKALQNLAGAGVGGAGDLRRNRLGWKARSGMLGDLLLAPSTALSAAVSEVRLADVERTALAVAP